MGKLITQEEVPEPFVEHIIPAIQKIDEVVESIPQDCTPEQIPEGSVDALQVGLQAFAVGALRGTERQIMEANVEGGVVRELNVDEVESTVPATPCWMRPSLKPRCSWAGFHGPHFSVCCCRQPMTYEASHPTCLV